MPDDHGILAPALTPRERKGGLDFGAAFEQVDFLSRAQVTAIAVFTALGEYPAFSLEDRSRLLYLAAKRSRVPVFSGAGAIALDDSLTLAREARRAGAAGVLLPPPHFFRYQQPELCEFYLQFARQLGGGIPVFLADTPEFATPLEPGTVRDLLASGNFAGVVSPQSPHNAQRAAGAWISAADSCLPAARRAGSQGALCDAACAVPELVVALDRALIAGDTERSATLEALLQEFVEWVRQFPFPVALKAAAGLRGVKLGIQPVPLSPERQRLLDAFCDWFKDWFPVCQKRVKG